VLTALSIRDVVLIDRLDLAFGPGLTVLTGETGAGKSILLDSLGLALGGSFAFLVGAKASASGHPIADMGPQLDFYSPEVVDEEDLNGPGIEVRGAALPGALPVPIVGHTPSFAWSVTIGVGDHIDIFAERLCNPDGSRPTLQSDHYMYGGRCVALVKRQQVMQTPGPNGLDPTATPETMLGR